MVSVNLALDSVNDSVSLLNQLGNIPTEIFHPLIADINQLMQVVQYFGTALVLLYVIFMFLRYVEFKRIRSSLDSLEKEVGSLKREIRGLRKARR